MQSVALFVQSQSSLTVQESFKGTCLRVLKNDNENELFDTINGLIFATNEALNVKIKLNNFQAYDMAYILINDYQDVKLEELIYIFKQGKKGLYGPHYNKFDIETVVNWINKYYQSEEYNEFLENRHKKPVEPELTKEDKEKLSSFWRDVSKNFATFTKQKQAQQTEIKKASPDEFEKRFKTYCKGFTVDELNNLIEQYSKDSPEYIDIIQNEINTRTK